MTAQQFSTEEENTFDKDIMLDPTSHAPVESNCTKTNSGAVYLLSFASLEPKESCLVTHPPSQSSHLAGHW